MVSPERKKRVYSLRNEESGEQECGNTYSEAQKRCGDFTHTSVGALNPWWPLT